MKVDLCDPEDPGWAAHVSLEAPLQRVLTRVPVPVPVLTQVPVLAQDRNFGTHRTEVLSSVARMEAPLGGHSMVRMVVPSEDCGPVVRARVVLVKAVLGGVPL